MATFNEFGSGGILTSGFISFNYYYEGNGNISVHDCALVSKTICVFVTFGPGDIAFSAFAANKGILEKICIKTLALNCFKKNCARGGSGCYPIYKDKYNGIWLDEDLLLQAEANTIIQKLIDQATANEESLVRNC